jgi:hypothetical protein
MNIEAVDLASLEVDGIDTRDYPDFCDAYFSAGYYLDGTKLVDEDLEELSGDGELVHQAVMKKLY